MRTRLMSIGLCIVLIGLSFCIVGCSAQTESSPKTKPYEYEGLQLQLPDGWKAEGNESIRISNEGTDGAIVLVSSGAFPNAVLNSDIGKILSMEELIKALGSGFSMPSELNLSVIQDHPVCSATSVTSNDGDGLYSFYGFCFNDHAVAMVAKNTDNPTIAAILSSYSFTEPCSEALVLTASDMASGDAPKMNYKGQYEPKVGMSQEDVLLSSWGEPTKKNVTETAAGTSEQWVYPNGHYVYFDDGIVSAIQK